MDMKHVELAASIVFDMLKQHPEICPHRYEWHSTNYTKDDDGNLIEEVRIYRCMFCGNKMSRKK